MKPNNEFFQTLGQYVYKYVDDDGKLLYVGKGNGDRCLSHLKDKGFTIDHCYIVARNLELFEEKKDWQSFLLESYLIATQSPSHNAVSGHYKECFVMTSLSSMFNDFQTEQYDNFSQFPEWYVENYDTFKGRLREVKINSGTTWFLSNARNGIYMMWYWSTTDDGTKITFEVNQSDDGKLEATKVKITTWLIENGYEDVFPDGKKQKIAINVATIEEVIALFKKFMS